MRADPYWVKVWPESIDPETGEDASPLYLDEVTESGGGWWTADPYALDEGRDDALQVDPSTLGAE